MKEMMMIHKLVMVGVLLSTLNYAQAPLDSDFDGVPDTIDVCPQTPFLNEVNAKGCTVSILTLPEETQKQDLTLALGYGYSTNEDLKNRETQRNTNFQLNYYNNNWNYSLHGGYYTHNAHDGLLDTTLRIKKRIKLNTQWILGISAGVQIPTHDYNGNEADYLLSSTIHYYPSNGLSFFAGYAYTYMGDHDEHIEIEDKDDDDESKSPDVIEEGDHLIKIERIQNQYRFHLGVGYFITEKVYSNFVYSEKKSKFESEHKSTTLSSTLYYKIDKKWFTTLYCKREILDEDLHDTLLFKIGYHIW
jgi:hypothetical protein